ncbi:hypothetical protein JCM10213v2_009022 [Rhodosporidiobolus nylandii]
MARATLPDATPCTPPTLPVEIIDSILSLLFLTTKDTYYPSPHRDFARYCRVSRAWLPIAQRYLYRAPSWLHFRTYALDVRVIEPQTRRFFRACVDSRQLAALVEELAIHHGVLSYAECDRPEDEAWDTYESSLVRVLSLCTNLRSLRVYDAGRLNWGKVLERSGLQRLEELRFQPGPARLFPAWRTGLPALKTLDVDSVFLHRQEPFPLEVPPPDLALQHLSIGPHINGYCDLRPVPSRGFEHLTSTSRSTLLTLSLFLDPHFHPDLSLFSSLHTLHLFVRSKTYLLAPFSPFFANLPPSLHVLNIGYRDHDHGFDDQHRRWSIVNEPTTLSALPPTLEEVRGLPLDDDGAVSSWIQGLPPGAALRRLTMRGEYGDQLERACRERHIELARAWAR